MMINVEPSSDPLKGTSMLSISKPKKLDNLLLRKECSNPGEEQSRQIITRSYPVDKINLYYVFSSLPGRLRSCWFPSHLGDFAREKDYGDSNVPLEGPAQEGLNPRLKPSSYINVFSFLSNRGKTTHLVRNDGERVDINVVKGKYLLIACFSIPFRADAGDSDDARAMIDSYSELASSSNFEMVVVVSMKKGFENDKFVFNRFLYAFPCLAVPFKDSDTRNSICSTIGFRSNSSTLLVNPQGIVLQNDAGVKFIAGGSEWFPFKDSDYLQLRVEATVLRIRLDPFYKEAFSQHPRYFSNVVWRNPDLGKPLSLCKDILLCDPSFQLNRVGSAGGSVCVSELSNKYVGLYLCIYGEFMRELAAAHQKCIDNNKQLEIVLICLPIFKDSEKYQSDLDAAFRLYNITSWLLFRFDNKVSRRIWRSLGLKLQEDKFVILPPNSKPGEVLGREVIENFGIDQHPFTRASIREERLATLKSLTPVSLFTSTTTGSTCLSLPGSGPDPEEIESRICGKRVLLYCDWLCCMDSKLCSLLMELYPKIQDEGCEVVFFPLDDEIMIRGQPEISKMPWPYVERSDKPLARQVLFEVEDFSRHIIAFEKDGKILSRNVVKRLFEDGFGEHLFKDTLYDEITDRLTYLDGVASY